MFTLVIKVIYTIGIGYNKNNNASLCNSLTLSEKLSLRMFEDKVLRIFVAKK